MPYPARPLVERFWEKVDRRGSDECWLWRAAKTDTGYGLFTVKKCHMARAHRVAYELLVGSIPEGLQLDHLCRNRACVNPAHLEPVTHRVNVLRGESPMAQQARQIHCKRGHPLSGDNLVIHSTGARRCRICVNEGWARRDREKRRERRERAGEAA